MLYHSPVGLISIKSSNGFINEIQFISDEELSKNSTDDKPTEVLKKCCAQLDEYFSGTRQEFELPLKQSGTIFQEKVWNELMNIPFGKTISYLELAKRINNVKAIRAVGTANGRNNLPIIVPCHRIIGSNGKLVGYSSGLKIKQWLLEHEMKHANGVNLLF